MRKEVFFAILAGAIFGLIIAFGIWKANSKIKTQGEETPQTITADATPYPSEKGIGLTIAKPEEYQVFSENPVLISGISKSNAWITISGEEKDYVLRADENGSFEEKIDLTEGANQIIVTSIDENGNSNNKKFILVFSSDFSD